jgi:hypothetical protein
VVDELEFLVKKVTLQVKGSVVAERADFLAWWVQSNFQGGKVICLDETGFRV